MMSRSPIANSGVMPELTARLLVRSPQYSISPPVEAVMIANATIVAPVVPHCGNVIAAAFDTAPDATVQPADERGTATLA